MSTIETTKCDACGMVVPHRGHRLPMGWVTLTVSRADRGPMGLSEDTTQHACSPTCTVSLLYATAVESGGKSTGEADPKTGQPYR